MSNLDKKEILIVSDVFSDKIFDSDAKLLQKIYDEFMKSYVRNKDTMDVDAWLAEEMEHYLIEHPKEDIKRMAKEIVSTIKAQEEKKLELQQAINSGRSKEDWFASEIKKSTSYMETAESVKYLKNLDEALRNANESLYNTIKTQADVINRNPQLDGFIAEQYHAQTFNLNAEATGSIYRAKVLEPTGQGYGKNSVDIVIVDDKGKIVKRYQSKYCKDSTATAQAFEKGDYRGQQKLIPEGQEIDKKHSTVITAPDGTTSKPLSKERAKELQKEAQSGQWQDWNWNEYKTKDLAIGIGKQAAQAAVMGAAITTGFDVAKKLWNGEEIKGKEVVETALITGADIGIKAAAAGALKVGVEKSIVKVIPKGTPAATIANIANIAIENVKIINKMVAGDLSFKEGIEKMEQTTVSTVAGIAASGKGMAIGAAVGSVCGPVGVVVGGFVGGTVGYMAGSKVGETVVKGVQKIRNKCYDVISSLTEKVYDKTISVVSSLCSGIKSLLSF